MIFYILVALSAFVMSLVGTRLTILALRRRPAVPSLRGSQRLIAPRGGIAAVMVMIIGLAVADINYGMVLALFMLGYILWTIDRLASPSRAAAAAAAHSTAAGSAPPAALTASATARAPGTARPASIPHSGTPGMLALAPRLATGYKIAMGIGMGYMLVMML